MAHLRTYYAEAKPFEQYIQDMEQNQTELLNIYKDFDIRLMMRELKKLKIAATNMSLSLQRIGVAMQ